MEAPARFTGHGTVRSERWSCSRRTLALIGLLVVATSADPAAARNDLVSSSARFSSGGTYDPRHRLKPRRIERRLPADDVAAPTFPTTTGSAHPPAAHASAWHKQLPVGGAVGQAVLVIGAVIIAQTLGDHKALPQLMRTVCITSPKPSPLLSPHRFSLSLLTCIPATCLPLFRGRPSFGGNKRGRSGHSRSRRRAPSACTARRTRSLSASPPAATAARPCHSTFADCCVRL